jgi:ectoine hydroxylase-related dioxygenase (phytanoyl-CoA dioxygenase family)
VAEKEGCSTNGQVLRAFDLTGEPGDVIIVHPWLFHSGSTNANTGPRFMLPQFVHTNRKISG